MNETLGPLELESGHSVLPAGLIFQESLCWSSLSAIRSCAPPGLAHWTKGHHCVCSPEAQHLFPPIGHPHPHPGTRLVPPTAGMDEDLHRPVESVPVGQGDNDALGRSCGWGSVGSDLMGGTLHPWVAQKGGRGSAVLGEIGAQWGNMETQVGDEGPPTCCVTMDRPPQFPHWQNGVLDGWYRWPFPPQPQDPLGSKCCFILGHIKKEFNGRSLKCLLCWTSRCSGRALIDKKLCPCIPLNP